MCLSSVSLGKSDRASDLRMFMHQQIKVVSVHMNYINGLTKSSKLAVRLDNYRKVQQLNDMMYIQIFFYSISSLTAAMKVYKALIEKIVYTYRQSPPPPPVLTPFTRASALLAQLNSSVHKYTV